MSEESKKAKHIMRYLKSCSKSPENWEEIDLPDRYSAEYEQTFSNTEGTRKILCRLTFHPRHEEIQVWVERGTRGKQKQWYRKSKMLFEDPQRAKSYAYGLMWEKKDGYYMSR